MAGLLNIFIFIICHPLCFFQIYLRPGKTEHNTQTLARQHVKRRNIGNIYFSGTENTEWNLRKLEFFPSSLFKRD
ncbi:MAG: hypothetical protein A2017_05730 [Lentisphaerae bacterium GWF2_44_16]|nr:MAG: hypothetical protein A2017_05730 [Lentisphaerae bacterium GWF2_44_16]